MNKFLEMYIWKQMQVPSSRERPSSTQIRDGAFGGTRSASLTSPRAEPESAATIRNNNRLFATSTPLQGQIGRASERRSTVIVRLEEQISGKCHV